MSTRFFRGRELCALACVFLGQGFWLGSALAWGPGGHMVSAAIAYHQLPPAAQQQATAILQAHPAIAKWKEQIEKDHPADPGQYCFMRASTWPDEIRRSNSPYDHPAWHYVDYPLTPPDFPFIAGREPENNVLFGINDCQKVLRDQAATPEQRAAALSWLIHLVGDLHQPLHCAEYVTGRYPLPDGDRGGNLIYVSVGGNPINLHSFWDRLPGMIFSPQYALGSAERIERTYPASALPELTKAKDPVAWSLEGRTIAIESAYLNGKLPVDADTKASPITLPPDYLAKGKTISDQRLALAGYRLGAMVTTLLSGGPTPAASASPAATAPAASAAKPAAAATPASQSVAERLASLPGVFDKPPASPTPARP